MLLDDLFNLALDADGLVQGDDDLLVVGDVVVGIGPLRYPPVRA